MCRQLHVCVVTLFNLRELNLSQFVGRAFIGVPCVIGAACYNQASHPGACLWCSPVGALHHKQKTVLFTAIRRAFTIMNSSNYSAD